MARADPRPDVTPHSRAPVGGLLAVEYFHHLIVTGPPTAVGDFVYRAALVAHRRVAGKCLRQTVPFSFESMYAMGKLTGDVPEKYAGADPELLAIIASLRERHVAYSQPMMAAISKSQHFASMNMVTMRESSGKAFRSSPRRRPLAVGEDASTSTKVTRSAHLICPARETMS